MAAWSWCECTDGSAWSPPAKSIPIVESAVVQETNAAGAVCLERDGQRTFVRCGVCTVGTEVVQLRCDGFAGQFVFRMFGLDTEPACVHWTRLLQGSRERKGKR